MWLYLYLVVDVWSRKVLAWDLAEVESAEIAADLVQRACIRERYRRPSGFGSKQCLLAPLILHADNGNAMRGATLESRLEVRLPRFRGQVDRSHAMTLRLSIDDQPNQDQTPVHASAEAGGHGALPQ
ncbi:DDE-type integrase/transposase/recombinase [Cyanobium sp. Morenito 9A2]|nr:DDE-type integrase/transposase/recombinase [Cyanobium sp. Morenito 9A2]MCP9850755.1 DDE-type integrase/transposase/recombinase [Cyanobium sp. Morenito 9A2]